VGVEAGTADGPLEVRAALVVADGRHSTVWERVCLPVDDVGAPIKGDVSAVRA
jgi:hypothetical protein